MKKIISILGLLLFLYGVLPLSFVSCTDVSGNGIDSIYYGGSTVPQHSSYRNPVWEPDLSEGTIFQTSTSAFVAICSETQWAKGITYHAPIISSTNLMEWNFNQGEAFLETITDESGNKIDGIPSWAEGRIHSMTAGFAMTVTSTSYWLFYQIGDSQAIGAAYARTAQGPYTDTGKLFDNTDIGSKELKQPFFVVFGASFYLLYSTEEGSYLQKVSLRRATKPTLDGNPVKLTGSHFEDLAIYRVSNRDYYLFGTVKDGDATEVRYARSASMNGPYLDKDGNDLMTGKGTLLIESGSPIINPQNVCGIFQGMTTVTEEIDGEEVESRQPLEYIVYNAIDVTKPKMDSGFDRKPLFVHPLPKDEEGWFTTVIKPEIGWTSPRFSY